jgi:hypothetical protein
MATNRNTEDQVAATECRRPGQRGRLAVPIPAHDKFEDNLNPIGAVFYAASTLVCTPASLSQEVGLALGAQAGEARIKKVTMEGGFNRFRRVAETPFNLVFEARPYSKMQQSADPGLNENLDYFGQTVNVAARVQALAEAGEICLSEALYSAPGVGQLLGSHCVAAFDAPLRGVDGSACVYRVARK